MKLNKLSALCAVACVAMSGQAMAQLAGTDLTNIQDAQANKRVVFISGASAVQAGFTGIIGGLFSGTPVRLNNLVGTTNDFQAVSGKLAVAAGTWPVGANVVVIYRVKGGSVFGVDPVARKTAIESLDLSAAACTTGLGTVASPYRCTTSVVAQTLGNLGSTPDAGVSDVAPALFDSLYNTEGEVAAQSLKDTGELGKLTPTPLYGLAFGVPLTSNLPLFNLNKAAVSAIMTGNVGTWNQVDSTLPANDILICRRTPGSGTQAVENLYSGNYPCDTGTANNAPADRDASSAWDNATNTFTVSGAEGGLVVVENGSSGGVRTCLDTAVIAANKPVDGLFTSYTTTDRSGVAVTVKFANGQPHKAIGVLSMDSLNSSKTTGNWQFRSLDGAGSYTWDLAPAGSPVATGSGKFPTLASYVDGTWDKQGWISFNVPNDRSAAELSADKLAFLNQFIAKAQDPAILASIANLKFVTAGLPGVNPPGTQVLRSAYLNGNQCAPYNRNN